MLSFPRSELPKHQNCFCSLLSSMRMTCPTQRSRFCRIMVSVLVDSAMSRTCKLETPKRREVCANLLTMIWTSDLLCAIRAQSSANSASRTVFSTVFVVAVSRQRLNREAPSRCRRYIPCSRSLLAWFNTQVKNRLKKTGASIHPCLTPLEMLKRPVLHRLKVLSCRRGTGESGLQTWSGTPAWTESPRRPLY